MLGFLFLAVVAAVTGWLVRRVQRRRAAAGVPAGLPCMARHPAGRGRWRSGRVYVDQGAARWLPRRGPAVGLAGARTTGVRPPSVREGLSINPASRIVACTPAAGPAIEIAVMPLDLRELLAAVPQAEAEAEAGTGAA
ncbi:hypothetical protein ACIGQE_07445 [Streptomyces sp. NPDC053429]|uniref:hypothetical protein n=1 Tax=Streptomyces sp. NPDC053429 TaxID=3365702 RepID=UPI0037D3D4A3